MFAADVMTHPVVAIDQDAPLVQAIRLMIAHKISGLPVVGRVGQLAGILTEGDLLRRVETGTDGAAPSWFAPAWFAKVFRAGHQAERYVVTHGRRVSEVMTPDVITATETTPLSDIVELMQAHRVRRVPVVRGGMLLGIVSRSDIVRLVGDALAEAPASVSDGAIRDRLRAALDAAEWGSGKMVMVAVKDGVVALDGCLFDIREREATAVLAENVPGVTRVENRIVCIEPYSGMVTYDPAV